MSKLYVNIFVFFTFIDFSGSHSYWPHPILFLTLIILSGTYSCWRPSWDFVRPVVTPRLSRGSSSHCISAGGQSNKPISLKNREKKHVSMDIFHLYWYFCLLSSVSLPNDAACTMKHYQGIIIMDNFLLLITGTCSCILPNLPTILHVLYCETYYHCKTAIQELSYSTCIFIGWLYYSAMTMEELLESLTKKTRTECEESHRQLIAAFNGMAGWYIINQQVSV